MLTQEEDMEIAALHGRGWSVSAIARHTGRDRKTVKAYLAGQAKRRRRAPSVLEPYRDYLAARFVDDPHVLGSVLFREVGALSRLIEIPHCCLSKFPTWLSVQHRRFWGGGSVAV
jgi:transposase